MPKEIRHTLCDATAVAIELLPGTKFTKTLSMQVILFGIAREIVGQNRLTIEEPVGLVGELKEWMKAQYPGLNHLTSLAVAVDSEYAEDDFELAAGHEIALIPPVSGG